MKPLRHSLPSVYALLVFEAAARHGNLTLAAEELCIAASAVSRHVTNLERQTGLRLFARRGNRLELTTSGRRLANSVGDGFGHVREVLTNLQRQTSRPSLTLGCSYDLAHTWLMPKFRALAELVPDYELRVITSDTYANFDGPDIDVSVRYGDGRWSGFEATRLFGEEVFPICAPQLLAANPELRNAAPAVLASFPLLRLTTDDVAGLSWTDWFRFQGVRLPVVKGPVFANYSLMLLELVAGRGIALGFAKIVDGLLSDGRVVRLSDCSLRSQFGLYAVYRESPSTPIQKIVGVLGRDDVLGPQPATVPSQRQVDARDFIG
jgi:LysR family transcriptional regulator, glycine cleavage system transcriptional activator